jgi:hypothetical protein
MHHLWGDASPFATVAGVILEAASPPLLGTIQSPGPVIRLIQRDLQVVPRFSLPALCMKLDLVQRGTSWVVDRRDLGVSTVLTMLVAWWRYLLR